MISTDIPPDARRLMRFVVIADTHVNPDSDLSSSPYPSGVHANMRAAAAVARIRSLMPDFVLHLGDMIHPVPGEADFSAAGEQFASIWKAVNAPVYMIPGNHDIGDKPARWVPAPAIGRASREEFLRMFGNDRHAFDFRGCRFIMFDSSLVNSGLPEEEEQWSWLDVNIPRQRRSFLALHYPPFLLDKDEAEHYDNIAEPGRTRLLDLVRGRPVEAIFSGHAHNVFLNRWGSADIHVVPAVAFVRSDYAQLFPVAPSDEEFGRNHASRLGFCVVEVYAESYTIHWVHTFGSTVARTAERMMPVSELHPRKRRAPIGVDLRHEWARPIAICHAGGVDEFGRKYVRNDYPAMRLQSLGVRVVRIPVQDVLEARAAGRVLDMAAFGHRFVVFCFGWPKGETVERLSVVLRALMAIEVILPPDAIAWQAEDLTTLRAELGVPVFLSCLHISAHSRGRLEGQKTYSHFIQHGFIAADARRVFAELARDENGADGVSFRIERGEPLWRAVTEIAGAARAAKRRAVVHVRLAGAAAAEWGGTPAESACLVADATLAGWAYGADVVIILDTFVDLDRGYFPRQGLIDCHCDLNPSGYTLQRLATLLAKAPDGGVVQEVDKARVFQCAEQSYTVLLAGAPPSGLCVARGAAAMRLDSGIFFSRDDGCWEEFAKGMPVLIEG